MKKFIKLLITLILIIAVFYKKDQIFSVVERWNEYSFCDRPITYTITRVDPEFEITKVEFELAVKKASDIWNKALEKELLIPGDNGYLKINLVYDGRQKVVGNINDLNDTVEVSKDKLEDTSKIYDGKRADLENKIKELNKEIEYWNNRGGADESKYRELQNEQAELKDEINELNQLGESLNKNVDTLNNEIHELNSKIENFNSIIKVYPEMGTFTSGVNKIDIYFYKNEKQLIHVLTHEIGHAIGLGHVENRDALMNPVSSESVLLTDADILELNNFCENKSRIDLMKNDLSNYIYTLASKLSEYSQDLNLN